MSTSTLGGGDAAVYLHIYDLTKGVTSYINSIMKPLGIGAFHAGVEVYGTEFSYQGRNDELTGIFTVKPTCHPMHIYRETVIMGVTELTPSELECLILYLEDKWVGNEYNILTKNCLNFADLLCNLIGVGSLPKWVMNLQACAIRSCHILNNTSSAFQEWHEHNHFSETISQVLEEGQVTEWVNEAMHYAKQGSVAVAHGIHKLTNYMHKFVHRELSRASTAPLPSEKNELEFVRCAVPPVVWSNCKAKHCLQDDDQCTAVDEEGATSVIVETAKMSASIDNKVFD